MVGVISCLAKCPEHVITSLLLGNVQPVEQPRLIRPCTDPQMVFKNLSGAGMLCHIWLQADSSGPNHASDGFSMHAGSHGRRRPTNTPSSAGQSKSSQEQGQHPVSHCSASPPCSSRRRLTNKLKRERDAEDAARIAQLSQDLDWGYKLQLPKRLQRKVTAQLHREWD